MPPTTVIVEVSEQGGFDPGVWVAALALGFTILSFWWLYARPGHLRMTTPRRFAMSSNSTVFNVRFPAVFVNTGAKAIVVESLQMWAPGRNDRLPLPWRAVRSELDDKTRAPTFPSSFSVQGRSTKEMVVEFGAPFPGICVEPGEDLDVEVEAFLLGRRRPKSIARFTLAMPQRGNLEDWGLYDNRPRYRSRKRQKAADEAWRQLLQELPSPRPDASDVPTDDSERRSADDLDGSTGRGDAEVEAQTPDTRESVGAQPPFLPHSE